MSQHPADSELVPEDILSFIERTPPFDELTPPERQKLAGLVSVATYQKDATILLAGKSEITHLALIYKGGVKLLLADGEGAETVFATRGPGQGVGTLGILRGSLSNLDVVAQEETTFLLLAREHFLHLIQTNPRFSHYYLKAISESYVGTALKQLRQPRGENLREGSLFLFSAQVGDLVRRRPVVIPGDQPIREAALKMTNERVGSLLVENEHDQPVGIITDRDLRRVVAQGLDFSAPVKTIMAAPLMTIPSHLVCFDALLEMMKRRVHHLVMQRGGKIEGVISGHDLMVLQGSSPLYLVREITGATEIEELYDLALKSPRVVHSLILDGAKPGNITRMITLINDYILDKLLTLLQENLGPPPVPFCWLLMGSEGRKEQTYKTDQDNGLCYQDPKDEDEAQACERYFRALGNETARHLVNCGFPKCKGGIMASNPQWCQPLSVWKGYFDNWITTPEPKDVLHATIFFDFRPGYGALELGQELRSHLMSRVRGQDLFLRFLAKDCMTTPQALSFFRRLVLEKSGEHKNKLDLKHKGLVPFVDFARVMSLRSGVAETNTLERLQLLGEGGHISNEMYRKTCQAYEIQMELRLLHQDSQWGDGVEPDNYIDPGGLSELERNNLKEALGVVSDVRTFLNQEFRLSAA